MERSGFLLPRAVRHPSKLHRGNVFEKAQFEAPPEFFRPGVIFPVLCQEDLHGLKEKFSDLKAKGVGWVAPWLIPASRYGKYTGSTLRIDYDTEAYWLALKALQAAAEHTGISIILHDEPGWPSGQAGGKILERGGETWMRRVLRPTTDDPLHAMPFKKGSINPDLPQPDLLNPAVGRAVVELVLDKHRDKFGGKLPDCMPWVYADEPTFGGIGHDPVQEFIWTPGLEKLFADRYGYALEPFLPALTEPGLRPLFREAARARVDYFDLLADLFEQSYLNPIFRWCEENKVIRGGHLLLEHDPRRFMEGGHGHLLRSLRHFHIPGIDSIFQESHPLKRSHHFPKYASSIARQTGRLCSSMPFGASSCAVTPAIFKWTIDHELVRGINLFLPWGYSPNADIHYQWSRPVFGHFGPLWKYMDLAYTYIARLSHLLALGAPECRIAVYFDMRSIWAGEPWRSRAIDAQEAIARRLLETQHDFDFIDDLALKTATVSTDGKLLVGEMTYDMLVVPATEWMESAARQTVSSFSAAGGKILDGVNGAIPDVPLIRTATPQPGLRVCKRNLSGESLYFLVNEGNVPVETSALFFETAAPQRLDPEDGTTLPETAEAEKEGMLVPLRLVPWESRVYHFVRGGEPVITASPPTPTGGEEISNWSLRVTEQTIIQEGRIQTLDRQEMDFQAVELGDWCRLLSEDFSGSAEYRSEFALPAGQRDADWILDLGEVRCACSVSINGIPVGRKLWAPFIFTLPAKALTDRNVLTVEVSNTLSNLFTSSGYLDKVDSIYSPEGARYVRILEEWEKEARPSGLYGPVRLRRALF
jgi:hypothetical protein